MADIALLRNQRGRIKGAVTRTLTFADGITDTTSIEDITIRLEKLEEHWQSFLNIDDALMLHEIASEYDEFEDKYLNVKVKLCRAINQRNTSTPSMSGVSTNNEQLNSTMSRLFEQQRSVLDGLTQGAPNPLEVKLPQINIPTFNGDYKDWPSFKDLFISSVHQRASLSNVHKFQHLKSALKDEAASLIKHITITNDNYNEAWNKLMDRYDKKKQVLTSYIKSFMNQAAVSQGSTSALRRITDTSDELIRGIRSLGAEAASRDPWLVHILLNKCDGDTRQAWAEATATIDMPSFEHLIAFLNKRCDALESIDSSSRNVIFKGVRNHHAKTFPQCPKCTKEHYLFHCPDFKAMNTSSRRTFVSQNSLCFNCLSHGHTAQRCNSKFKCHVCNQTHHSSLHEQESPNTHQFNSPHLVNQNSSRGIHPHTFGIHRKSSSILTKDQQALKPAMERSNLTALMSTNSPTVKSSLLPTALVHVIDATGSLQECRILIDSGSTASFIRESFIQQLGHKREKQRMKVSGIGRTTSGFTKGRVQLVLYSRFDHTQRISVTALILPKLTTRLPSTEFNIKDWDFLESYDLADPQFNIPHKIDVLLGIDHALHILREGQRLAPSDTPAMQNTIFGYIIAGPITASLEPLELTGFHAEVDNIDKTLRSFWEIEDLPQQPALLSEEEQYCETLFKNTCRIDERTGRYVVRLPFKQESIPLGNTEIMASARLRSLERRFKSDETLRVEYHQFLNEYQELNHLEAVPQSALNSSSEHAYLPHHAVIKPTSTTTKLRVVFDGSTTSSSGFSLNQKLCVGPKIQRDLYPILLSFRTYKVAVTADIEKMFRQILVAESDRNYQRILWRSSPEENMEHLWLKTVTYGTASAPFLATRALQQLSIEFAHEFPLAENALKHSFYVDDLMSGADDETIAVDLYLQLTTLLQKRGFTLRKWASNSQTFLQNIPTAHTSTTMSINEHSDTIKVLGLSWKALEDSFIFDVTLPKEARPTKRRILSESSRIFDPLGLISPIIIEFKILIQHIWIKNYDWDEPIQDELAVKWNTLVGNLSILKTLRIPRWLSTRMNNFELHGFCDASEAAYAAVIYCRSMSSSGEWTSTLMTSKTKVAPIKQLSIPRLELCAALLLIKLISSVRTAIQTDVACFAWTDSTVVLHWLSSHPSKWKCFIGNRTSEILSTLPRCSWYHVFSKDNPAGLASRGVSPSELVSSTLWWNGPSWLQTNWRDYIHELSPDPQSSSTKEMRSRFLATYTTVTVESNETFDKIFSRNSSLIKIFRIVARCLRFPILCKKSNQLSSHWLSATELETARRCCIQWAQQHVFTSDINSLQKTGSVTKSSPLRSLSPFLDEYNLLRVGGRLEKSFCAYETKHPCILPKDHVLTQYLIDYLHKKYFHAGITLLLNIIRQKYWIISARTAVKRHINNCVTCIKIRARTSQQLMANLPSSRVTFSRAFARVGVDYAGPLFLLRHRGRGAKSFKGYIALFTCLSTRALHLEAVSELTSDAFIACLKRFTARRGLPSEIFSDNGTNFVGANHKLSEIFKLTTSRAHNNLIADFLSAQKVTWHFTPPAAPHFGGTWESGVKLVKARLRRTIGDTRLTFEEFSTLLAQIEALINSRPLTQLSDDINSLDVLTPSHFLIGQAMVALPESPADTVPLSARNRWRFLQRLHQEFWRRWHIEYLTTLQHRPKWTMVEDNLKIGELVLVKEEGLPPTAWLLARILKVHPGSDNLIRVVTLKTTRGELKRPVTKVCRLPIC